MFFYLANKYIEIIECVIDESTAEIVHLYILINKHK